MNLVRLFTALAVVVLWGAGATTGSLAAQVQEQDTAEWLEECRRGEDWSDSRRHERHCEVRELRLRADDRPLAVDARPNGGISVQSWDGSDIRVQALVSVSRPTQERARADAQAIRIQAEDRTVRASGPESRDERGGWSVSYRVWVPRQTDLRLRSTNGGLSIRGVNGDIELETTNGGISVAGGAGNVRGRTTNGGVTLRLDGQRWQGAGVDLRSTNGGVTLHVPVGYSARIETGTVNGGIHTDFPVTMQGTIGRDLSLQLGDGGPPIRVRTTNGGVSIRRS